MTNYPTNPLSRPLADLQAAVGAWGEATFPLKGKHLSAWHDGLRAHLEEEMGELAEAMTEFAAAGSWQPASEGAERRDQASAALAEECADILLMLLHLAHRHGFDLASAAAGKFQIVQSRTWETEPGAKGYRKHVEPAGESRAERAASALEDLLPEPYDPMKVWTWPKAERDAYNANLNAYLAGYDPETDDPGEAHEMDDPEYRARCEGREEDWGGESPNHGNGHTLY